MRRRGVDSIEEGPILERTSPSNLMLMLDRLNIRQGDSTTTLSQKVQSSTQPQFAGIGVMTFPAVKQPSSGSNPTGSGGQKVSSGMLITALQTAIGSSRRQDVMTFFGSGSCLPGYNI